MFCFLVGFFSWVNVTGTFQFTWISTLFALIVLTPLTHAAKRLYISWSPSLGSTICATEKEVLVFVRTSSVRTSLAPILSFFTKNERLGPENSSLEIRNLLYNQNIQLWGCMLVVFPGTTSMHTLRIFCWALGSRYMENPADTYCNVFSMLDRLSFGPVFNISSNKISHSEHLNQDSDWERTSQTPRF